MGIPVRDGPPRSGDIAELDTAADGDWPVDPDLFPRLEAVRIDDQRGTVVVTPSPRSGRAVGLAIVALLVIAALAAALAWTLSARQVTSAARQVTSAAGIPPPTAPAASSSTRNVPSLVGRTLADARRVLDARGLALAVRRTPSRRPRGLVLAQSPAPGERLVRGEKVLLIVAAAPAAPTKTTPGAAKTQVKVPTVTGLLAAAASAALRQAGLEVDEAKLPSSKPPGTVVSEDPATGTAVDRGSTVRIEVAVASGLPKVTMPHLVGLTLATATSQLRSRGLRATVEHVVSSEVAGTVLGQTPVTGAQLRRGMTVTLRVASAPAKIDVPDVTGLDAESAQQQLTAAGFRVQVDNQPVSDASQDGVVIDESPAGGSQAAKGSTVTITVGQAATQ